MTVSQSDSAPAPSTPSAPVTTPTASRAAAPTATPSAAGPARARRPKWGKVVDQTKCIGCHACSTACKSENEVPLSVNRTFVKSVDVGEWPAARRAFQVTRCNQCENPPCVTACPTTAMHQRPDGIVDFNKNICIGCKACIAACPYDAIFINPEDHCAEKCNFCAHRLEIGLEPACVVVCPTQAIMVGDLNDPASKVAQVVGREPVQVRRPEKDTRPKLFYTGAHQATLDPLAARRPDGDLLMWSEQPRGPHIVPGGASPDSNHGHAGSSSSAAALLSYDVPHRAPWDWRVSAYTWTKGIAAGGYLVPAVLRFAGVIPPDSPLWVWVAPLVGLVFLAITGALLLWDLEHPERFWMIFAKFQWQSWLVKGAVIITAYGALLTAHLAASIFDLRFFHAALAGPGVALAALTAVYTAWLFAQAKARDLWQSPLLPPHMLVQCVMAGTAVLVLLAPALGIHGPGVNGVLRWVLAASCFAHALFVVGEVSMPHATSHARAAVHEMIGGRYAAWFWCGLLLVFPALFLPLLANPGLVWIAALSSLSGLLLHEHAYVQSGQSVPLA